MDNNIDIEALRKRLLDEAYASAFSGLDSIILDVDEIKHASAEKLLEIAKRYGMK